MAKDIRGNVDFFNIDEDSGPEPDTMEGIVIFTHRNLIIACGITRLSRLEVRIVKMAPPLE